MTTTHYGFIGFAVLCCSAGCWSDRDDLTSVEEGVYEIERWSINRDGCDVEGPSVLETWPQEHVLIKYVGLDEFIAVEPCLDREDCLATADALGSFPYGAVDRGNREDGFARRVGGSTATGDICRYWIENATLTTQLGVAQFERRTQYVDTARNGLFCSFNGPDVSSAPCHELEVLAATMVTPLP